MLTNSGTTFLPVIVGTDLNAYTMASSFYEKYGIKPVLVGKIPMRFTEGSTLIQKIHYNDNLTEPNTFKAYLAKIANQYNKQYDYLILIGTNDIYVNLMIDHQKFLQDYYVFKSISQELRDTLFYKKAFYDFCQRKGIEIPKTRFYDCSLPEKIPTDFPFPMVVKPSNVVAYQEKGLHAVHKLYFLDNQQELENTIKTIVDGGYKDELVLQEFIPGDDTNMWDSVYYGDRNGKGQLITLAQVLLQERQSHLVGAYTALMVRYNKEVMLQLANFLEDAGYTGFANFDIKLDPRDNKLKVFEVNIRQGRSSSYISYTGHHLAEYLVDDLIYKKDKPLTLLQTDFLYSVLPNFVIKKNLKDEGLKTEVKKLIRENRTGNPLISNKDKGLKRSLQMTLRRLNYYTKYKN